MSERRAAIVGLALATLAAAIWLFSLDSHLTFIADDWELLVKRHGWGADYYFDPYHENIVVGPAIVYRALLLAFGMGSSLPFYVVSIGLFLTSAVLLFALLRRRVGDWPALVAAVLVLFLGAAFEDLLWAFQMGYFGSMVAGLGMLLALDREDERGDAIACALLAVSLAFSSLGLTFGVGAAVEIATGRRPRARRAFVALLPFALYALWWVGWGHTAESDFSLDNIAGLPEFVYNAASAGIVSLLGLATGDGSEPDQPHLIWGQLLLLPVLAGIGWRVYRERGLPRGLAIALALGVFFWVSAALVQNADRLPTSSRYQYGSAVFLLLIAAETLRGLRVPRLAVGVAAGVTVFALTGGIPLAEREYEERWRPTGEYLRSTLAAVDIAGESAQPGYRIAFAPTPVATAARYLDAKADYGTPAYTEGELEARPAAEKEGADLTLAQALGLALREPAPGDRTIACEPLQASAEGPTGVTLLQGGFTLANETGGDVEVVLSRFAGGFPVSLGPLPAGVTTALEIPVDGSERPWNLGLKGEGPVRLCTTEPAAP
ncbi:MAG TPA: hypothetical protein VFY48_11595 [Solirubrobacterales bacterium]|nr:hypothetical protein [Solirubrobacterales bacterium]